MNNITLFSKNYSEIIYKVNYNDDKKMVSNYRVVVVNEVEKLNDYIQDWNSLIDRALEANVYLTPGFLIPALRYNNPENTILVVFIYEITQAINTLVGIAAFNVIKPSFKMPCRMLSTDVTSHSYLATPLIDRKHALQTIETLWQWMEESSQPWRIINIQKLPNESRTWQLMESVFERLKRNSYKTVLYERPILLRYKSFDDYLKRLPRKRRKEYGRLSRKLERAGKIEVLLHLESDNPIKLANRFMDLERKSWKGTIGSALIKKQDDVAFFREIMLNFGKSRKIFMVELRLNDEPIAMSCNFIMDKTLFAFKVAYDPAYREYSPGIMAEYEGVRLFHEFTDLESADSGANGNSYIRNYWLSRTKINNSYIALPGYFSVACLSYLTLLIKMKQILAKIISYKTSKKS